MDDIDYKHERSNPAVRISVEGRGRQTGSSRVAHLLSMLLWLSGYRNIKLVTNQSQVQVPDFLMTEKQIRDLENVPIQIVEMVSLDLPVPLHVHEIKNVENDQDRDVALERATKLVTKVETLFDAIKHGDEDHQGWLKEAIRCHFNDLPMPEYVVGKPKVSEPAPDVYQINRMTVDLSGNTPEEIAIIQDQITKHLAVHGAGPCPNCNYIHTHCRCQKTV